MNRIIHLSILGCVSILPLLILPTMVGALVDYVDLTESQAGWVAATGGLGGALAAILIAVRIRHLDPRKLAIAGLLTLAIFDAVSMLVGRLPTWLFITSRALSGFGGAAAYAAVMASFAALPHSERGYGVFMVFQFALSALGLYLLPFALPYIGVTGTYLGLSLAALLALSQTSSVMSRRVRSVESSIEIHMLLKPAAILAMVGIGLFETANNAHFTYAERIGVSRALADHTIGEILGVATLLGIPAGFAVVWLGDRFGQVRPIVASLLLSVVALTLLLGSSTTEVYVFAMCTLSVAWAFGLPYFQAFEARLDPGGSVVVAGGFFTAVGGALGPAIAAIFVIPGDYSGVLLISIAIYVVVACLMVVASRFGDRG